MLRLNVSIANDSNSARPPMKTRYRSQHFTIWNTVSAFFAFADQLSRTQLLDPTTSLQTPIGGSSSLTEALKVDKDLSDMSSMQHRESSDHPQAPGLDSRTWQEEDDLRAQFNDTHPTSFAEPYSPHWYASDDPDWRYIESAIRASQLPLEDIACDSINQIGQSGFGFEATFQGSSPWTSPGINGFPTSVGTANMFPSFVVGANTNATRYDNRYYNPGSREGFAGGVPYSGINPNTDAWNEFPSPLNVEETGFQKSDLQCDLDIGAGGLILENSASDTVSKAELHTPMKAIDDNEIP